MAKSAVLKQNEGFLSTLPVGVIIAWHRDLDPATYLPTLPPGWVECNGQLLNDKESPYNGKKIPDLNTTNRFLQGNPTSGSTGGRATHDHSLDIRQYTNIDLAPDASHFTDGTEFRVNPDNNLPPFFDVVWIMKVKQTISARATPSVLAAENAPHGALYINRDGNVGIGTTNPTNARLEVAGELKISSGNLANIGSGLCFGDDASGFKWIQSFDSKPLYINPLGTNLILNRDGGNVGIGTANPTNARLEVAGELKVSSGNLANVGSGLRFGNDASGFKWIQSFDSKPLYINPLGNNLILNRDGGKIGIGTTNPLADIGNGSLKYSIETRGWILARGNGENTWGDGCTRIGVARPGGGELDAWYISANPDNKFSIHQAGLGNRLTVDTSGNVGIGTMTPGHRLHVDGGIYSNYGLCSGSSRRWKKNIRPIEGGLKKVQCLRGVSFDWIESGKYDIGLIAEEVGDVIPEVVTYEENGKDAKGLDYSRLVAVLIEAVKEQQQQIDDLKAALKSSMTEKHVAGIPAS